ncbi:MAG: Maf family protein [Pseudomonadota bacterium]
MSGGLILASGSPRRAQLLGQLGYRFSVARPDVDETQRANEPAADYVRRLALAKLTRGAELVSDAGCVVAGDTIVLADRLVLGKPATREACLDMLARLSGRAHQVLTGMAVGLPQRRGVAIVRTQVLFRSVSMQEAGAYWDSGEPRDKAGGYGIQGAGGAFVRAVRGSYSNVVGLPQVETGRLLAAFSVAQSADADAAAPSGAREG